MAELLLEIAPRAKGEIISISIVSPGSLIRRALRLAPNRCGRMTWHEAVSIMARRRRKGIACRLARWASDQVAAWLEGPSRIEWR